ncbi:Polypeptide N-acetylgalactosaminyltransferase 3 [Strongyloides ratti]|uniref:Polypeptide N-acetylgalactosaminyltransferase n=1 Tax=Strongyloides ratti TaxID=34506 RepID=A0A090MXL4_STRRB|nr:Polypeptide N-acetylgalactosaminyltransferase 3 [Strongyloides ratti]CEF65639.1 Polypeptide N-acetylgalactosaminyltransferase 3 [Strongyloides ratti]
MIRNRLILLCLIILIFIFIWITITLFFFIINDNYENTIEYKMLKENDDTFNGHKVQVVVGHYIGSPIPKSKINYTYEELNSNSYNPQKGYGSNGLSVHLNKKQQLLGKHLFEINQFNLVASDLIAANRSLPDQRRRQCRKIKYDENNLPDTSVIIVYHNEAYSTLIRTITSVINRSPSKLLKEIILVDDFSSRLFLKKELEDFVIKQPIKIKILRSKKRVGLIKARLMGANEATAKVLTFLDSHCECTIGWLEPLLQRIKDDRRNVPCPVIDVINDETFSYQKGIDIFRGGFNWNLQFRWYSISSKDAKERKNSIAPIPTPTMAGGLFSIDRNYFFEMGSYDINLDIWGGENIEMSFRIWQCFGRIEIILCSRVGHIFRKNSPHDFPEGKSSNAVIFENLARVAEVWMDDWKHLFYKTNKFAKNISKKIDISDRVELRKQLRCRNFEWYLKNIWPDHFLPMIIHGESLEYRKESCLHWHTVSKGFRKPKMHNCSMINFDSTEMWLINQKGQIRSDENVCLSASLVTGSDTIYELQIKECMDYDIEYWKFDTTYNNFVHLKSKLCLDKPSKIQFNANANVIQSSDELIPKISKCNYQKDQEWSIIDYRWKD